MVQFEEEKSIRLESLKHDINVGLEQVERGDVVDFDASEIANMKNELHSERL